jgi:hypothetical protein
LDNAVLAGEKAIALAEPLESAGTLAEALNNVGTARLTAGDEAGRELLIRSLELAQTANMEDHAARALINLACADVRSRNYPLAVDELARGISYCTDHDLDPQRLFLLGWSAQAALDQGRWDTAADEAGEVLQHPGALSITRVTALAVLGRLRARRGDPDPWSPLDDALALALPAGDLRRLVPVAAARAEAAWLTAPDRVVCETDVVWSAACAHGTAWDVSELAFWRWRGGALTSVPGVVGGTPYGLQIAGDPAGAAALWAQHQCPYDRAIALVDSEHEGDVRAALAELEQLGARPAARYAASRLRELGAASVPRGPRLATRQNPDAS